MAACTVALTVGFGSSDRLAGAYGTAVSTTMLLTTVLLYHVMRARWGWALVRLEDTSGFGFRHQASERHDRGRHAAG